MVTSIMPDLKTTSLFEGSTLPAQRFSLTAEQVTAVAETLINLAAYAVPAATLYVGLGRWHTEHPLYQALAAYPHNVALFANATADTPTAYNIDVTTLAAAAPMTRERFVVFNGGTWRVLFAATPAENGRYACVLSTRAETVQAAVLALGGTADPFLQQVGIWHELTARLLWRIAKIVKNVPAIASQVGELALPLGFAWLLQQRPLEDWNTLAEALQRVSRATHVTLYRLDFAQQQLTPLGSTTAETAVVHLHSPHVAARSVLANETLLGTHGRQPLLTFPIRDVEQVWGVLALQLPAEASAQALANARYAVLIEVARVAIMSADALHAAAQTAQDALQTAEPPPTPEEPAASARLDAMPLMVEAQPDVPLLDAGEYALEAGHSEVEDDLYWPELDEFEQAYLTIDELEDDIPQPLPDDDEPERPTLLFEALTPIPAAQADAVPEASYADADADADAEALLLDDDRRMDVRDERATDTLALLNPLGELPDALPADWATPTSATDVGEWPALDLDPTPPQASQPQAPVASIAPVADENPPQPASDALSLADLLLQQQRDEVGMMDAFYGPDDLPNQNAPQASANAPLSDAIFYDAQPAAPAEQPLIDFDQNFAAFASANFDFDLSALPDFAAALADPTPDTAEISRLQAEVQQLTAQLDALRAEQAQYAQYDPQRQQQEFEIRLQAVDDERAMLQQQVFELQAQLSAAQQARTAAPTPAQHPPAPPPPRPQVAPGFINGLGHFVTRMRERMQRVARQLPAKPSGDTRLLQQVLAETQTATDVLMNLSQALDSNSRYADLDDILNDVLAAVDDSAMQHGIQLYAEGTAQGAIYPQDLLLRALYNITQATVQLADSAHPIQMQCALNGQQVLISLDFVIQATRAAHYSNYFEHFRDGVPQQSGLAFARTLIEHIGGLVQHHIGPDNRVMLTVTLPL